MTVVEQSLDVRASVGTCYKLWSHFEGFPRFMQRIKRVSLKNNQDIWNWEYQTPQGKTIQWDVQVETLLQNHLIQWKRLETDSVGISGTVQLEALSAQEGTHLNVILTYHPEETGLEEFSEENDFWTPAQQLQADLEAFKHLAETLPETAERQQYPSSTMPMPTDAPGDMPGIGEEYQKIGVSRSYKNVFPFDKF
jgi:uncharacterized membrane protein